MCTNYIPTRGDRLQEFFRVRAPTGALREAVWPGHMAPMLTSGEGGTDAPARRCVAACFGLIPGWSRDGRNFRHCYNARSETVASKPSFRNAWRRRQFCVVPADAFFEPGYETGRAVRWRISPEDGHPLALAAIWEAWRRPAPDTGGKAPGPAEAITDSDGWLLSFALLTVNADEHPLMKRFHRPGDEKRTVVPLAAGAIDDWLNASRDDALGMLAASGDAGLTAAPDPLTPERAQPARIERARPKKAT